jgi:hypothetical protein
MKSTGFTGILTFSHQDVRKLKDHPELQQELEHRQRGHAPAVVRGLRFLLGDQPKRPAHQRLFRTLFLTEGRRSAEQIRKNLDLQVPWFS